MPAALNLGIPRNAESGSSTTTNSFSSSSNNNSEELPWMTDSIVSKLYSLASNSTVNLASLRLPNFRAKQVVCGENYSLVLTEAGEVFAFGSNSHG